MKYKNAKDILPPELIEMLQDYYEGGYLYIPQRTAAAKRKETAYKVELEKRDQHIYRKYLEGWSREQLVSLYHLSESSLRRIILKQKRRYQEMKDNIKEMISRWGVECNQLVQKNPAVWEVNGSHVIKMYEDKEQLERNIAIVSALNDCGIPVTQMLPTTEKKFYVEKENQYYILYKKLEGNTITEIHDLEMAYQMGQVIGRLHIAFKECEEKIDFWNNNLLEEMQGWIREILEADEWTMLAENEYKEVTETLEKLDSHLPKQLIHRDMHLGNFLFSDNQFTGYIDFDLSQKNIRIFDICYFLAGLLTQEEGLRLQRNKWMLAVKKVAAGYESVTPLSDAEKEAIPCVMESIEILFAAYFISVKDVKCAKDAVAVFHYIQENESDIRKALYD